MKYEKPEYPTLEQLKNGTFKKVALGVSIATILASCSACGDDEESGKGKLQPPTTTTEETYVIMGDMETVYDPTTEVILDGEVQEPIDVEGEHT